MLFRLIHIVYQWLVPLHCQVVFQWAGCAAVSFILLGGGIWAVSMNICAQVLHEHMLLFLLGKYPGVESLLGHVVGVCLAF